MLNLMLIIASVTLRYGETSEMVFLGDENDIAFLRAMKDFNMDGIVGEHSTNADASTINGTRIKFQRFNITDDNVKLLLSQNNNNKVLTDDNWFECYKEQQ